MSLETAGGRLTAQESHHQPRRSETAAESRGAALAAHLHSTGRRQQEPPPLGGLGGGPAPHETGPLPLEHDNLRGRFRAD